MKISSEYRGEVKDLVDDELKIIRRFNGSIALLPDNNLHWSGNIKHYHVNIPPWELRKLRDACNEQLGNLTGVKIESRVVDV